MTLTVDKAGRVVLPKALRDRMGLHAGSDIEVMETSEGIVLRTADREPPMVREGKIRVHTGKLPPGYDILRAVDDLREERFRFLAGL